MKKILSFLAVMMLLQSTTLSSNAMTFEEGLKEKKPMAVLVYADWADSADKVIQAFDTISGRYSKTYNFIKLDIASSDAKAYNDIYPFMQKLPYVMLFKEDTRFSRQIRKDCAMDVSCFKDKLDIFNP